MEVFDIFEKENHLQPNFNKANFDELKGWDLGWDLLEPINIAKSTDEDKELSKRFSPGQKALYFFWYLDGAVTNGGFIQFYWNGFGYYLSTIREGLKLVGDSELIKLIDLADNYYLLNQVQFETLRAHDDYPSVYKSLNGFQTYDDAYYKIRDNTMQLIEAYARKYPEEFVKLI
ncbi:MAG: hypothetical protein JWR05_1067 [Mucilaginibacter sp.]|nr:hypothetical protein [Mucilaginibacter sp.]